MKLAPPASDQALLRKLCPTLLELQYCVGRAAPQRVEYVPPAVARYIALVIILNCAYEALQGDIVMDFESMHRHDLLMKNGIVAELSFALKWQ